MINVTLEPWIADDGTEFAQKKVMNHGHYIGILGDEPNVHVTILAVYDDGTKEAIRQECERLKGGPVPTWVSPPSDEECQEALAEAKELLRSEESDDDDD